MPSPLHNGGPLGEKKEIAIERGGGAYTQGLTSVYILNGDQGSKRGLKKKSIEPVYKSQ